MTGPMPRSSTSRHAPYDAAVAGNFELSAHTGRLIAMLAHPRFVPVPEAVSMRDDDYVIGLVHGNEARAYPLWIIDYYHVVNDIVAGDPVIVASCERCQTGAAFLARLDGVRVRLYAAGMYNATLMLREPGRLDGTEDPGAWIHYEGVCVHGARRGSALSMIPTFHTTWASWCRDHPDTLVLAPPDDPGLPDSRDGHGREEYFSRPGIERALVSTIAGSLDRRYPENEMVLGLHLEEATRAYPLREVRRGGRIVEDEVGGHPIVVFAGPGQDDFAMACYARTVEGRTLSFRLGDREFVDRDTGTTWSIEGVAKEGPLAGSRLDPLPWCYLRWHAWVYFHPDTVLYRAPAEHRDSSHVDASGFAPLLAGLERLGRGIEVEYRIVRPRLPLEAEEGLRVVVGGDALHLYRFRTAAAAHDWAVFEGARSCRPIFFKVERKRCVRAGRFVVESDPDIQYADPAQIVRLPDPEIAWSDLTERQDLVATWSAGIDQEAPTGPTFAGLFAYLEDSGYEVLEVAFLPPVQLRPGVASAVAATLAANHFEIFKCNDKDIARGMADRFERAMAVDRFVFRSAPPDRFYDMTYEIGQRMDDHVMWSEQVDDPGLIRAIEGYLAAISSPALGSASE